MKLSAPKQYTWILALVLAVLGLVGALGVVDALGGSVAFWLAFLGAAVLLLATSIKGL